MWATNRLFCTSVPTTPTASPPLRAHHSLSVPTTPSREIGGVALVLPYFSILTTCDFVTTYSTVGITFDYNKNARNIAERGLPFSLISDMDWSRAIIIEDTRRDYGERRYRAFGFIENRLYALVFTPRGENLHIISFRKANMREVKNYDRQ